MPTGLWEQIRSNWLKNFPQDHLSHTHLGVLKGEALSTKFDVGDTVSIKGTVKAVSGDSITAEFLANDFWTRINLQFAADEAALVKRAERPNGTLVKFTNTGNRYVKRAAGWYKILADGTNAAFSTNLSFDNPHKFLD